MMETPPSYMGSIIDTDSAI